MAFMQPDIESMRMYHVETSIGTELIPEWLCSPDEFEDYCEGDVDGEPDYEVKEGWYARLSAPGYLDCTDYIGPFESSGEALDELCELYEIDSEGEPAPW